MITSIIFDFGNVFIEWDPRRLFQKIIPAGDMERFMREVWRYEWNDNLDRGATLADNARAMREKYPHHAGYIDYFHEHWRDSLGAVNPGSVALLSDLKRAGFRAYGLSNWSAETFATVRTDYVFFDWLDGIVISGEERVCKPDPAIYKILLERYALRASECLFIDDRQDNIDAALGLGIGGIQFRDAEQSRRELEAIGVL